MTSWCTRTVTGRTSPVAVATTGLALLLLLIFAVPSLALASYLPPVDIGDTYGLSASFLAAEGQIGSHVYPDSFARAADGTLWAIQSDIMSPSSKLISYSADGEILTVEPVHDFTGAGSAEKDYTQLSGLAFGPDGDLYTCCGTDSEILKVEPATGLVVGTIGDSSVFSFQRPQLNDLEFDRDGNLFVADPDYPVSGGTYGRIVRFSSSLTTYTAFSGDGSDVSLGHPQGLGLDASGNVWAADYDHNRIVEFSNAGDEVLSVLYAQGGEVIQGPQDVCVDGYGTVFVVDGTYVGEHNRFVRFAPDGTSLGSYPPPSSPDVIDYPTKIMIDSPAYGENVFVNTRLPVQENTTVFGAVEQWMRVPANPDDTPPVTTCDVPEDWQVATVTVTLSAKDEGGWGVDTTRYGFSPDALTTYTGPFDISTQGTTTVYFQSVDRAGNVEDLQSATLLLDSVPPVTSSTLTNDYYNNSTNVTLVPTDTVSGVIYTAWSLDGGSMDRRDACQRRNDGDTYPRVVLHGRGHKHRGSPLSDLQCGHTIREH